MYKQESYSSDLADIQRALDTVKNKLEAQYEENVFDSMLRIEMSIYAIKEMKLISLMLSELQNNLKSVDL